MTHRLWMDSLTDNKAHKYPRALVFAPFFSNIVTGLIPQNKNTNIRLYRKQQPEQQAHKHQVLSQITQSSLRTSSQSTTSTMCTQDHNTYTCGHWDLGEIDLCSPARRNRGYCPNEVKELPATLRRLCKSCRKLEDEGTLVLEEKIQSLHVVEEEHPGKHAGKVKR